MERRQEAWQGHPHNSQAEGRTGCCHSTRLRQRTAQRSFVLHVSTRPTRPAPVAEEVNYYYYCLCYYCLLPTYLPTSLLPIIYRIKTLLLFYVQVLFLVLLFIHFSFELYTRKDAAERRSRCSAMHYSSGRSASISASVQPRQSLQGEQSSLCS